MSRTKQRKDAAATAVAAVATRPWFRVGELATLLAVSRVTVWRWLDKAGIKSRGGKVWASELRERMPTEYESVIFAASLREAGVS